jgi:hypothetical protein
MKTMFYLSVPKQVKTTNHNRLEMTGGAWSMDAQCGAKPRSMTALYDLMRGSCFCAYGAFAFCSSKGDCKNCKTSQFAESKETFFGGYDALYIHALTDPRGDRDKTKELIVMVSPYIDEIEASKHYSMWYSASEVSRWNGKTKMIGNVIEIKPIA